jgi:hypothetical protein
MERVMEKEKGREREKKDKVETMKEINVTQRHRREV